MINEIPCLPDGLLKPENVEQLKNEPLLEYVWTLVCEITYSKPDINNLFTYVGTDPKENPEARRLVETFVRRLYNRDILINKNIETEYLKPDEPPLKPNLLRRAMEAYNLDEAKWWFLMLFVKDYVEDIYSPEAAKTPRTRLEELLKQMQEMEYCRDKFCSRLTFQARAGKDKSGKRGSETLCIENYDTMLLIRYLLTKGLEDLNKDNTNWILPPEPQNTLEDGGMPGSLEEEDGQMKWKNSIHLDRVVHPDQEKAFSESSHLGRVTDRACEYWQCLEVILKSHNLQIGMSGDKYALASAYFFMFGLTDDKKYREYKPRGRYNPTLKNTLGSTRKAGKHFLHRIYLW